MSLRLDLQIKHTRAKSRAANRFSRFELQFSLYEIPTAPEVAAIPRAALPDARRRRPLHGTLREARQDVGRGGQSWGGGRRVIGPPSQPLPPSN